MDVSLSVSVEFSGDLLEKAESLWNSNGRARIHATSGPILRESRSESCSCGDSEPSHLRGIYVEVANRLTLNRLSQKDKVSGLIWV